VEDVMRLGGGRRARRVSGFDSLIAELKVDAVAI
jgi:hypothetical protein